MFNAIEVHGAEALLEQLRDELSGRAPSLAHDDPGEIQTSRSASRRLPRNITGRRSRADP